MTNTTYTHEQWRQARMWADHVYKPEEALSGARAAVEIIRGLPEPKPLTLADIPEGEREQYLGWAIRTYDGRRCWLSQLERGDSSCVLLHSAKVGVEEALWFNEEIIPLPDEPRMVIPGVTPEPEPRVLCTKEDFKNAPEGTVVAWTGDVFRRVAIKYESEWDTDGDAFTLDNSAMAIAAEESADSWATVLRWGDGA